GRTAWREDPDYATPAARAAHQRALVELLAERLAGMPLQRAVSALRRRRVPCAPATGECERIDDPQITENGYAAAFSHQVLGAVQQSAGLTRFDGGGPATGRTAPLLGEHTRELLEEIGYTTAEVDAMLAAGAAGEPTAAAPR